MTEEIKKPEELPTAVPMYNPNLEDALVLVGQKEQYISQLRREMLKRAIKMNEMDDELERLRKQLANYEPQAERKK